MSASDASHASASNAFAEMLAQEERLVTHNYVLVEAVALVQRRLGVDAVRALRNDLMAVVAVEWVDRATHDLALTALIAASRRRVSLVDRVSFEMMRQLGVRRAFAFDQDFAQEGFEVVPA